MSAWLQSQHALKYKMSHWYKNVDHHVFQMRNKNVSANKCIICDVSIIIASSFPDDTFIKQQ